MSETGGDAGNDADDSNLESNNDAPGPLPSSSSAASAPPSTTPLASSSWDPDVVLLEQEEAPGSPGGISFQSAPPELHLDDENNELRPLSAAAAAAQQQQTAARNLNVESSSLPSRTPQRPTRTPEQPRRGLHPSSSLPTSAASSGGRSIPDRVATTALQAALDILKLAGGVTLSATGKLVAPPLHVTQKIILPSLWAATKDLVAARTPQRVKDWFRILSTSVHHVVAVLRSTARGQLFRQRFLRVYFDLVDCCASDHARQVLIDSMGCSVKLAEALHTPETKLLLDQLSVLGCRLVDFAASGRNKLLLHDLGTLLWNGCELLADPSTTLALAEVTAYLCHALEMEDAGIHELARPPGEQTDDADEARRRYERNAYQQSTYLDPALLTEPGTTVEQVILTSLGMPETTERGENLPRVPSNVVLENLPSVQDWETSSLLQQIRSREGSIDEEDEEEPPQEEWPERARQVVNVPLLREQITQRAAVMERQRTNRDRNQLPPQSSSEPVTPAPARTDESPIVESRNGQQQPRQSDSDEDVEDLGVVRTVSKQEAKEMEDEMSRKRPRVQLKSGSGSSKKPVKETEEAPVDEVSGRPYVQNAQPLPDETPIHHFHRVLDEILTQKRKEAVDSVLAREDLQPEHPHGRVTTWNPRAAAAAGAGNERGQDTIKARLAASRQAAAQIGVGGVSKTVDENGNVVDRLVREHGKATYLVGWLLMVLAISWFGFGCYGMYSLFFRSPMETSSTKAILSPPSGAHQQELVIRVIREVVHVDPSDKKIIGGGVDTTTVVDQEGLDKITQCVAAAL